jgi:hypothetical protein
VRALLKVGNRFNRARALQVNLGEQQKASLLDLIQMALKKALPRDFLAGRNLRAGEGVYYPFLNNKASQSFKVRWLTKCSPSAP